MNQVIPRVAETEVLRLIHQFSAVAVVGPRQVGKTTPLTQQVLTRQASLSYHHYRFCGLSIFEEIFGKYLN